MTDIAYLPEMGADPNPSPSPRVCFLKNLWAKGPLTNGTIGPSWMGAPVNDGS